MIAWVTRPLLYLLFLYLSFFLPTDTFALSSFLVDSDKKEGSFYQTVKVDGHGRLLLEDQIAFPLGQFMLSQGYNGVYKVTFDLRRRPVAYRSARKRFRLIYKEDNGPIAEIKEQTISEKVWSSYQYFYDSHERTIEMRRYRMEPKGVSYSYIYEGVVKYTYFQEDGVRIKSIDFLDQEGQLYASQDYAYDGSGKEKSIVGQHRGQEGETILFEYDENARVILREVFSDSGDRRQVISSRFSETGERLSREIKAFSLPYRDWIGGVTRSIDVSDGIITRNEIYKNGLLTAFWDSSAGYNGYIRQHHKILGEVAGKKGKTSSRVHVVYTFHPIDPSQPMGSLTSLEIDYEPSGEIGSYQLKDEKGKNILKDLPEALKKIIPVEQWLGASYVFFGRLDFPKKRIKKMLGTDSKKDNPLVLVEVWAGETDKDWATTHDTWFWYIAHLYNPLHINFDTIRILSPGMDDVILKMSMPHPPLKDFGMVHLNPHKYRESGLNGKT